MNRMLVIAIATIVAIGVGGGYALMGFPGMTGSPTIEEISVVDAESLAESLRARGMSAELSGKLEQSFFTVDATVLKVDGEDIQVFEYPSKGRAQEDIDTVTPEGQFSTVSVMWISSPHFYSSDTMIILYVGDTGNIMNALEDVMGSQFAGG